MDPDPDEIERIVRSNFSGLDLAQEHSVYDLKAYTKAWLGWLTLLHDGRMTQDDTGSLDAAIVKFKGIPSRDFTKLVVELLDKYSIADWRDVWAVHKDGGEGSGVQRRAEGLRWGPDQYGKYTKDEMLLLMMKGMLCLRGSPACTLEELKVEYAALRKAERRRQLQG